MSDMWQSRLDLVLDSVSMSQRETKNITNRESKGFLVAIQNKELFENSPP